MANIIIADDHVVMRQGLRALLSGVGGWQVVAEASNGFEVLPLVEQFSPDILILDVSMPNLGGIETIARLKHNENSPAILVLSAKDDYEVVNEAMEAGAKGFITKSASSDELKFAVNALLKGQTYLSPSVCGAMLTNAGNKDCSPLANLSHREREVMKLLAEGMPNRDVAKTLHISARTIDSHRANIMKKLGITSNAELVQIAIKHGLVE